MIIEFAEIEAIAEEKKSSILSGESPAGYDAANSDNYFDLHPDASFSSLQR